MEREGFRKLNLRSFIDLAKRISRVPSVGQVLNKDLGSSNTIIGSVVPWNIFHIKLNESEETISEGTWVVGPRD